MIDVGRVCMKIAGRDAGKLCVVVSKKDANFVKIKGFARERLVNVKHLEPLPFTIDIEKEDVMKKLKEIAEKLKIKN